MQADIDEEIQTKFNGELVYALLNKALHWTVQTSLLFWRRLLAFLVEKHGIKHNLYNYCVMNKVIDKKQCTIVW
jgi:hypothetical protein